MAGREIFKKRKQLRAFSGPSRPPAVVVQNPFTSIKPLEIHITTEMTSVTASLPDPLPNPEDNERYHDARVGLMPSRSPSTLSKGYDQYSVDIQSAPMSPRFEVPSTPRTTSTAPVKNNKAAVEANTAAWGYTKVALLFFLSLIVTWVGHHISHPVPTREAQY